MPITHELEQPSLTTSPSTYSAPAPATAPTTAPAPAPAPALSPSPARRLRKRVASQSFPISTRERPPPQQ